MDKLIIHLGHNPLIKRSWVQFRELSIDDFDVVETRAPTWVDACWKGSPGISKNWPRHADVTRVLKLKPELIAEIEGLKESSPDLFTNLAAQFSRDYSTKEPTWLLYPSACMQLNYRGCRKEDTARAKYEEAIAAGHEKIGEVVARSLADLNRGFTSLAEGERRRFQEDAVRLYADPTNWKPVKNSQEFAAEEEAIKEAQKAVDERHAALRKAKRDLTLSLFEEYLADNEAGASSLADEVRDQIRERLGEDHSEGVRILRRF